MKEGQRHILYCHPEAPGGAEGSPRCSICRDRACAHGWILQVHHHGDSSLAALARNDRMGVSFCLRTGHRRRGAFSSPSRDHRLPLEWA